MALQHINTLSVFKYGASYLTLHLAGYEGKKSVILSSLLFMDVTLICDSEKACTELRVQNSETNI
jgi:hypothetical protein